MKMTTEDFKVVRDAMTPLLTAPEHANLWTNYKAKGLTKRRFCWDTLWASKLDITPLYKYLNDDTITTALMMICNPYMMD
jgi:hypothetical protein